MLSSIVSHLICLLTFSLLISFIRFNLKVLQITSRTAYFLSAAEKHVVHFVRFLLVILLQASYMEWVLAGEHLQSLIWRIVYIWFLIIWIWLNSCLYFYFIVQEAINVSFADSASSMSKKDASSGLKRELLEKVCIDFVDSVVSIRYHYIFTMYITEYSLDKFLEFFKPKVSLLT